MCGITGYKSFRDGSPSLHTKLEPAIQSLAKRGPDYTGTFIGKKLGLAHSRLSIIDTSNLGNQPMVDPSGRYTLIFNGEIYNYRELKKTLSFTQWKSTSDTEVLLHLLIEKGIAALPELNGFFSLAFYDQQEDFLLLARDRYGIKPLHYYLDEQFLAFASEMKALLCYPIAREINQESLYWYLKLTYLPHDRSMIKGVKKLLPGSYLTITHAAVQSGTFGHDETQSAATPNFENAKNEVVQLLEKSVQRRMVADVPLGAFLSGGTDSSAVVSLASQFNSNLNTFSIGYKDHAFFDETNFAELVAKKFNTHHTTFSLTNNDLLESLDQVINYIDEPFADSSAIPTFILSQKVSQSMKVALSGDGADELFGGYYKHLAFEKANKQRISNSALRLIGPALALLPQSRSSTLGNVARRLTKYADLLKLSPREQYWRLASFYQESNNLLVAPFQKPEDVMSAYPELDGSNNLNDFLAIDLGLVLPGDMLTKVDLMSMANSLEVRVPFLDKELVAYAKALPGEYKVQGNQRKKVLQDAFMHILPKELHHRSKKGFEVPMLAWLKNELNEDLTKTVFCYDYLHSQGIFDPKVVRQLEQQLYSSNPGDVHATLWTLYVFQKWYSKYLEA